MIRELTRRVHHLVWTVRLRLATLDERGGGRNTDEGFHISAGAVIAGVIATAVSAFVANKLGVLK